MTIELPKDSLVRTSDGRLWHNPVDDRPAGLPAWNTVLGSRWDAFYSSWADLSQDPGLQIVRSGGAA